jgi:hypothetical protein
LQDLNFHIDFVTSATNIRALNFNIPVATRHDVKVGGKGCLQRTPFRKVWAA